MRKQGSILPVVILLTMLAVNGAFAKDITYTYEGPLDLGGLTLSAISRIDQAEFNDGNGVNGAITVKTDGMGVQGPDYEKYKKEDGEDLNGQFKRDENNDLIFKKWGGSKEISGGGGHQNEAIIFNYYSDSLSLNDITLGIINTKWKKEDKDTDEMILDKEVKLEIKLDTYDPLVILNDSLDWTKYDDLKPKYGIATLNLSDLFDFDNPIDVSEFQLKVTEGKLLINSISGYSYDDFKPTPTPEPATMLLLGAGLIGLAGCRRKFKKKS